MSQPEILSEVSEINNLKTSGEIHISKETIPDYGSLIEIAFDPNLPPHQHQEFHVEMKLGHSNLSLAGVRQAKSRGENIVGCGDFGHAFILHVPRSHTTVITTGRDSFPPIFRDQGGEPGEFTEIVNHPDSKPIFEDWMKAYLPDVSFETIYHPDVIASHLLARAASSRTLKQVIYNYDQALVEMLPKDTQPITIPTATHHWGEFSHLDMTSKPAEIIRYPLLTNVINNWQIDMFRAFSEYLRPILTSLHNAFYPHLQKYGIMSHEFLQWYFNGISGQTITIIPEDPNIWTANKESRSISSRFMATADFGAHIDIGRGTMDGSLSLPDSNLTADELIATLKALGLERVETIRHLIGKTRGTYTSTPTDIHSTMKPNTLSMNGMYSLFTFPSYDSNQSGSTFTCIASDGATRPRRPLPEPEQSSIQYAYKFRNSGYSALKGSLLKEISEVNKGGDPIDDLICIAHRALIT